jgi:hypothetical protein
MVFGLSTVPPLLALGGLGARGLVVVVMALVALGLEGTAASAHGPCGCLPRTAYPGDAVVTNNVFVFRAVWNPTRADIYYGQPALIAAHVDGAPRIVLLNRDRKDARERARLLVPEVPTGRYLVLLYDGSEGGAHYTWDSMTVRRRPRRRRLRPRPRQATPPVGAAGSRQWRSWLASCCSWLRVRC